MTTLLTRSRKDRVIGGVCGGLGDYFGIDPVLIRIFFVLSVFAVGISPFVYVLLWLIMPEAPVVAPPAPPVQVVHMLPGHPRPIEQWNYNPYTGERMQR